ncbi:MAG: hypothetical protein OXU71_02455 [Gammaproteobacteria bacterium]|nr:hypothetical protein [Gammaproteobacteria bacterium]
MTAAARTAETALNYKLAELLRRQRIPAEGERRHGGLQYDCLVDRDADWVSIEAEFAPAREVKKDAAGRIENKIEDKPVRLVVALVYPERLREVADQNIGDALSACNDLRFCFGEIDEKNRNLSIPLDGERPAAQFIRWGPGETGGVDTLADHLWSKWTEDKSIGEEFNSLVQQLDNNVQAAAAVIHRNQGARKGIIRALEFDLLGIDEQSSMRAAALILCNAMLFHELLSGLDDIPRPPLPGPDDRDNTARAWQEILDINWYPIFEPAREVLRQMNSLTTQNALDELRPAVARLARSNLPARHDLSGRVFHRLLIGGKYLSPNYTTITAAIVLSALALEGLDVDWSDAKQIKKLDITDPACGTGTLLVAAAEEIRRRHYRASLDAGKAPATTLGRDLLEHTLRGRDVVLAAVHLTAATLAMMETQQKISRTQLAQMSLTVKREGKTPVPYLGSLDYLSTSKTKPLSLGLPDAPKRVTGHGNRAGAGEPSPADKLEAVDLAILNPPFFKSQGIPVFNEKRAEGEKGWKPFFGFITAPADAELMRAEMQKRLKKLPATMKAGGSPFICLADESLSGRGTLACVLPAVVWSGSSWLGIRRMLAKRYHIDYVVVSHDSRSRGKTQSTPGRYYVSMSESTSLAETLIVARRKPENAADKPTRIVNLHLNPTHPIDANNLARQLIRLQTAAIPDITDKPGASCAIQSSDYGQFWGEAVTVTVPCASNGAPDPGDFIAPAISFLQTTLAQTAWHLARGKLYLTGNRSVNLPIKPLKEIGETSPSHLKIKGRKAPCNMTVNLQGSGYPVIWHHSARSIVKMAGQPNARLTAKPGREDETNAIWSHAGRAHVASYLRLNTQRIAAVWSKKPMLGVNSWNTIRINAENENVDVEAAEKALVLWLNSTFGHLLLVAHASQPYPGRVIVPIQVLRELPVIDVRALDADACLAVNRLWEDLANRPLWSFAHEKNDSTRQKIDNGLLEILKIPADAAGDIELLRTRLAEETAVRGIVKK